MSHPLVVIVGGGPAGLSTALFLAHAAPALTDRIVVLEKEHYPRDKFCAGAVGARADRALASIGIIVDVPSVSIGGIEFRAQGDRVFADERGAGRVVRRFEFDAELARLAQQRGITIRQGVRVSDVRISRNGVELDTSAGRIEGAITVGADGVGSVVRRALAFERAPYLAQAVEVDTEMVESDSSRERLMFDMSRWNLPGYYWDFPTLVDDRPLVCRGVYYLKTGNGGAAPVEIAAVLDEELKRRGLAPARYKKKRFAERGFHRGVEISRPRAVLVGEAAGIDPVTGEGIAQAIQYGQAAGRYLAQKLNAGDVVFADWGAWVRRSSVGRDLLTRTGMMRLYFGSQRPRIERYFLDTPEAIRVGLQHFGGKPWSGSAAVRGAWNAARAMLNAALPL